MENSNGLSYLMQTTELIKNYLFSHNISFKIKNCQHNTLTSKNTLVCPQIV